MLLQYKKDDTLKLLHEEIMSLDNIVNELLYREEGHLLPKMKDAQRNIRASEYKKAATKERPLNSMCFGEGRVF